MTSGGRDGGAVLEGPVIRMAPDLALVPVLACDVTEAEDGELLVQVEPLALVVCRPSGTARMVLPGGRRQRGRRQRGRRPRDGACLGEAQRRAICDSAFTGQPVAEARTTDGESPGPKRAETGATWWLEVRAVLLRLGADGAVDVVAAHRVGRVCGGPGGPRFMAG